MYLNWWKRDSQQVGLAQSPALGQIQSEYVGNSQIRTIGPSVECFKMFLFLDLISRLVLLRELMFQYVLNAFIKKNKKKSAVTHIALSKQGLVAYNRLVLYTCFDFNNFVIASNLFGLVLTPPLKSYGLDISISIFPYHTKILTFDHIIGRLLRGLVLFP